MAIAEIGTAYTLKFEPLNLSVAQACVALGIGRTKLYELIKDKKLRTIKIGARRVVPVASIRKCQESLVASCDTSPRSDSRSRVQEG